MTIDQLAGQFKAKYPAYAKMDNHRLVAQILDKYPQYAKHLDGGYFSEPPNEPGLQDVSITDLIAPGFSDVSPADLFAAPSEVVEQAAKGYDELGQAIQGGPDAGIVRKAAALSAKILGRAVHMGAEAMPNTPGQAAVAALAGPVLDEAIPVLDEAMAGLSPVMRASMEKLKSIPGVEGMVDKASSAIENIVKKPARYIARSVGSKAGILAGLEGDMLEEIKNNPKVASKANSMLSASVRGIFDKVANDNLTEGIDKAVGKLGKNIGDFADHYEMKEVAQRARAEAEAKASSLMSPPGYTGNPPAQDLENVVGQIHPGGFDREMSLKRRLGALRKDFLEKFGQATPYVGEAEHPQLRDAQYNYIVQKLNDLESKPQDFRSLLKNKREIWNNIRSWGKMGAHGQYYDSFLKRLGGELNDALLEYIPKNDTVLNPLTGQSENARSVWKAINAKFSDAVDAEGTIYREAAKSEPSKTSSRIVSTLREGKWKNITDAAKRIGPEAEQSVNEAKNIALSAHLATPGGSHHGSMISYLAISGAALGAYGAESGNRGAEAGGFGLLLLTSPMAMANLVGTPSAAEYVAKKIAATPSLRALSASAIVKYLGALNKDKKK